VPGPPDRPQGGAQPGDGSLAAHLAWLHLEGCTCPYRWQGLGRLYGISLGKGWVRLDTDPVCPCHGGE